MNTSLSEWSKSLLEHLEPELFESFCLYFWAFWPARNDLVFRNEARELSQIISMSSSYWSKYKENNRASSEERAEQDPPIGGHFLPIK